MRPTTKSFAIALVVSTLLSTPVFAARNDAKRQPRTQDQQPTIVRRVMDRLKHFLDLPVLTQPTDIPVLTQPSDIPVLTQPTDGH